MTAKHNSKHVGCSKNHAKREGYSNTSPPQKSQTNNLILHIKQLNKKEEEEQQQKTKLLEGKFS